MEPSHLSEPWILKEVVGWIRNYRDPKCENYIAGAFITAPKKATFTSEQEFNAVRDQYIFHDVQQIISKQKKKGYDISEREACRRLWRTIESGDERYYWEWDTEHGNTDLNEAIRNAYKRVKGAYTDKLPWPYYGRDVEVDEDGEITIFGGR